MFAILKVMFIDPGLFERILSEEYACQIWSLYLKYFQRYGQC